MALMSVKSCWFSSKDAAFVNKWGALSFWVFGMINWNMTNLIEKLILEQSSLGDSCKHLVQISSKAGITDLSYFPGAKQNHNINLLSHRSQNKALEMGYGNKKKLLTCQCLGRSIARKGRKKTVEPHRKIMQCYETDVEELIKCTYPLYLKIIFGSFQP